jgi:hypothetical protein
VTERERELQRKREQRQRPGESAVRSKPAHDQSHPAVDQRAMLNRPNQQGKTVVGPAQ